MFIVGLTGGIGSGKSAVSAKFQSLKITVVDADIASRKVVEPSQPALTEIKEYFGPRCEILFFCSEFSSAKVFFRGG